jgi:hypothetical protein
MQAFMPPHQTKRSSQWRQNLDILRAYCPQHGIDGYWTAPDQQCIRFAARFNAGRPSVNFYPSTGRWRVDHLNRTFGGGARVFLEWYKKQ